MIKYIHIDYRHPNTKRESTKFAISNVARGSASIFFNTRVHRKGANLTDTFFHEMAHVFLAFHGAEGQMSKRKEEQLAKLIGAACAEILK